MGGIRIVLSVLLVSLCQGDHVTISFSDGHRYPLPHHLLTSDPYRSGNERTIHDAPIIILEDANDHDPLHKVVQLHPSLSYVTHNPRGHRLFHHSEAPVSLPPVHNSIPDSDKDSNTPHFPHRPSHTHPSISIPSHFPKKTSHSHSTSSSFIHIPHKPSHSHLSIPHKPHHGPPSSVSTHLDKIIYGKGQPHHDTRDQAAGPSHLPLYPPFNTKNIGINVVDSLNHGHTEHGSHAHFPSQGYDLDPYFHDFPVFGYFHYSPDVNVGLRLSSASHHSPTSALHSPPLHRPGTPLPLAVDHLPTFGLDARELQD